MRLHNFILATAAVFTFAMAANEALADHNDDPYIMVIIEFDANGDGALSTTLPPIAYPTAQICAERGIYIGAYLENYSTIRAVVSCLHPNANTLDELINTLIERWSSMFPALGVSI